MSIDAGVTQERGSLLAHERLCHQHFYDLNKKCTKTDGRGGKMMATMANRLYGNGVGAYDYGGKYNRKNTPSNRRAQMLQCSHTHIHTLITPTHI